MVLSEAGQFISDWVQEVYERGESYDEGMAETLMNEARNCGFSEEEVLDQVNGDLDAFLKLMLLGY